MSRERGVSEATSESIRESDARLLDAAARLFRERGYAKASLRRIAQAADMLPGSIHYRYPTKLDLYLAVARRAVDTLIAAVAGAMEEIPGPADGARAGDSIDSIERIRAGLRAHLESLLNDHDGVFAFLYESRSVEDEAAELLEAERRRYEAFWDARLAEAAGHVRLRPGVDLTLARHFGFGALNWAARWYEPDGPWTPAEIADAFSAWMAFGVLDSAGLTPPPSLPQASTKRRSRERRRSS